MKHPEKVTGVVFAVVGAWIIYTSSLILDDPITRAVFLGPGLFLFGMGIFGYTLFRNMDKEELQERARKREEEKEQKEIERQFKRIQEKAKKQFN